ncbi:MAG: tRNA (N(6)-L-threonylcarbamoyladenosine(37)-C(2))-methylthiotransferase [Candidatus Pacearchaeota archaeon]|nr:tRNA (N(6)-L-threonylcarbamoyladenosine(37)-C(2))-methylthiotransferase [Candidatus Pacearchaeota archaeon]
MLEIYFETYGCTANYNSTEIMKGLVRQAGLNITENIDNAEIIVINSCIVKEPTEEKIRRLVQDLTKKNKTIILAGCMAKLRKDRFQKGNIYLLDTHNVKKINDLIKEIIDKTYDEDFYLEQRNEIKANLPKISKEKFIGITQISEGCLGKCTYCLTRIAKGRLFSYPEEKILESIKNDLDSGCKEIWITSQDNANYGNENGEYKLHELLSEILAIKKKFFLRIGMMNPDNVLKILPELLGVYKSEKIYKFIHIPVQSGSNKILEKMKRNYTKEDFLKIVNAFKKEFPNMHISTDVIVGFPGESDEDFEETYELVKELEPETINFSKFWPRPHTLAEKMKKVDDKVVKERIKKIAQLHKEICNKKQREFIGTRHKVLVNQKGFANTYLARDINYKLFAVQNKKKILGKVVNVKVVKVSPHYLISEVI